MNSNRRRGGILAGVAITVLVVAVLAGAVLVWTGVYIARNVHVTEKRGDRVTVETPFGSLRVREGKGDPRQLGLPVYPGAIRVDDNRKLASFEFDAGDTHKEFAIVAAEYRTDDSVEKVREFYRQELPHWMITARKHGSVKFEFTEGGQKKIIVLSSKHDGTRIALASVGEPASN